MRAAEPTRSGQVPVAAQAQAPPGRFVIARRAITFATLLMLIVPAGAATADPGRETYASVTVDCRRATLLHEAPLIQTDARHAALVRRAGAIPLVSPPKIASDTDRSAPTSISTDQHRYLTDVGVGAGTAVLILGSGTAFIARRRKSVAT